MGKGYSQRNEEKRQGATQHDPWMPRVTDKPLEQSQTLNHKARSLLD